MHAFPARRALIIAALIVLGGCSGISSPSGPLWAGSPAQLQSHGASGPVATNLLVQPVGVPFPIRIRQNSAARTFGALYTTGIPLVFEADESEKAINVYKAAALKTNPPPIVTIALPAGCPYGMALDKTGALYVASFCGGNSVYEYPKGMTSPSVTITSGLSNPVGLAIDKAGTLFVSNYSPASITEYAFHKTSPSKTITGQGLSAPFGLALDTMGNLYVADFGASQVFEVPVGTTTVKSLGLQDLTEPLGVAVDKKNGDLWVTDGLGDKVNVYKAGSTTPFETITTGYSFPYAIGIDEATGAVVVSNTNNSPTEVFAYKPNHYTSYATLTSGISQPTGLLWAKP